MRLPWCHGLLVALGACYMVATSSAQPAKKREPAAEGELKQLRQVIDEAKHERSLMDKEHRAVPVKRVPAGDKKILKSLAGQQARSPSHKRTPHHEQGKKLQKRIFGVVLGQDYGSSKSSGYLNTMCSDVVGTILRQIDAPFQL